MPRPLRIHQPGGFYHVTMRGNHQRDIFYADGDRHLLNKIVARAIEKYDARVHAYCWMTNHIHLLMQVGDEPLACSMRQIAAEYARAMQLKINVTGHFFERRYHARLVQVNEYLLTLLRYIHLNPVAARVVDDPARYRWSSHHNYVGRRTESWVTTSFALGLLGTTPNKAMAAYLEFVGAPGAADWQPPSVDGAAVKERGATKTATTAPAVRSRQTLEELIAEACARFDADPARLHSPLRDLYLAKVRGWIAVQASRRGIATLAAVARALGRDEATLRYAMRVYSAEMD
jgi:putative transposase